MGLLMWFIVNYYNQVGGGLYKLAFAQIRIVYYVVIFYGNVYIEIKYV